MYCRNCGSADEDGKFCSNCGTQNENIPTKARKLNNRTDNTNTKVSEVANSELTKPSGSSTPGFVLSIIGAVFVSAPIVCLPLSITGLVLSKKRLNFLNNKGPGTGLAKAGFIIGICAASLTTLFMLLAIPGAWQHNFG
jgi:hypothetical protein